MNLIIIHVNPHIINIIYCDKEFLCYVCIFVIIKACCINVCDFLIESSF